MIGWRNKYTQFKCSFSILRNFNWQARMHEGVEVDPELKSL